MGQELEPGMLVRRTSDGQTGRVERVEWATSTNGSRFVVVVFKGTVYLPSELEQVEERP